MEFDPKGVFSFHPDGESKKKRVLNAIGRRSSNRLFAMLGKSTQNGGMERTSWNSIPRVFFVSPRWGKSKKRVLKAIGRRSSNRLFAMLGKSTQNGGMERTSWNSILREFIRFATMWKVEKTRFDRNYTTFINPSFCTHWKSHP